MALRITRRLEFDAGHRVLGHEGKCRHLHGHRYVVLLTVWAPKLDSLGRVVDFGVLKSIVGKWIDDNLDHNILLHEDDPLLKIWMDNPACEIFAQKEPYVMQSGNPTAENIAEEIYKKAEQLLPSPLSVTKVRVYETPNCFADYWDSRDDR